MGSVAHIEKDKKELVQDVHRLARLGIQLVHSTDSDVMVRNGSESSLVAEVKAKQGLDPILVEFKEVVLKKVVEAFTQGGDSVLRYQGLLCVPNIDDLREHILSKVHSSCYLINLGATKMYRDFKEVNVEHQKPGGLSQYISIPTEKWEDVNMNFIVSCLAPDF
ncbi:hypothetical protein MTR67_038987 [Solanum verrucosum]|uniref:Uncharacterized protein n=1 Tax=Solanum verrucosum TaxID=315347 RepID=A0AAF0ZN83_SOLVR|nr:hypothetical protein MTR67_038987 [Solanum verrucosum]